MGEKLIYFSYNTVFATGARYVGKEAPLKPSSDWTHRPREEYTDG
jgi:hypothetical protein